MALYALEDLDDALDVTRAFLTPIDRTLWIKLAFVVFFIGGPAANTNAFQYTAGGNGNGGQLPAPVTGLDFGIQFWLLIAGIIGVLLVIGLAFAIVGSIMEFVFIESLRKEEVTIRGFWGQRWKQGLRLFGFRFVLGLFVLGGILLVGALSYVLFQTTGDGMGVAFVLLLVPVMFVLAIGIGLVNGFTTVFVVPIMILEDCGVLDGWRRLWPTITAHWEQYLAYVVASFFLTIFGGILVAIVTALLAILLLIPFGILFAIGFGLVALTPAESFGMFLLVVFGILFVLAVIAVAAIVQVPVQSYLRYYAILVLGDVESELDLIPERRAAVRESEAAASE